MRVHLNTTPKLMINWYAHLGHHTNLCHWRCCLIMSCSSQKPDCDSYRILTCCRYKNRRNRKKNTSILRTAQDTKQHICTNVCHTSEHVCLCTCWWWRAGVLVAVWAYRWYWASCGWGCPAPSCPYCWSCRSFRCLDRPESDSACSSCSSVMSPCWNII